MVRKKEIIIFAVVFCLLLVWVIFSVTNKTAGNQVAITQNGQTQLYPLNQDKTVELAKNTVIIKGGEVYVSHADCPNQICVKTGKISNVGEQIACIPNQVLVEIRK